MPGPRPVRILNLCRDSDATATAVAALLGAERVATVNSVARLAAEDACSLRVIAACGAGHDALRAIRRLAVHPASIPTVVVGVDREGCVDALLASGAAAVFPEPVDAIAFAGTAATLIRLHEQAVEAEMQQLAHSVESRRLLDILHASSELGELDISLDVLMQRVCLRAQALSGASGAVVELIDGEELEYAAATGSVAPHVGIRLKVGSSLSGLAVTTDSILSCDDTETDDRVDRAAARKLGVRSMVVVPLRRSGHAVGVLKITSGQPGAFDEFDIRGLVQLGRLIASSMERQAAFDERERLMEQRSAALEALRQSNSQLSALLDALPLAAVAIDRDGRVQAWSEAASRLFGWQAGEVLGKPTPYVPEEFREQFKSYNDHVLGGAPLPPLDVKRRHKDGHLLDVTVWSAPLLDAAGRPAGAVKLIEDAGPRLAQQRALRQARDEIEQRVAQRTAALRKINDALRAAAGEQAGSVAPPVAGGGSAMHRFDVMFGDAGVGITIVDREGRWIEVNRTFCDLLDYQRAEMLALSFQDITHPDDLQGDLELAHKLFDGEIDSYTLDKRYLRRDGTPVWVTLVATAVRDAGGRFVEAIGVVTDISARKAYEQAMLMYQRAIESVDTGVIICDAVADDAPIVYVNAAFTTLTGYPAEEAIGRNCRFLQGHDRDQIGVAAIRHAIKHGRSARATIRNYRRDGSAFLNELTLAPVADRHGTVTHFVGIQNDVTERERMLAELRDAHQRLEDRVEQRTLELQRANATLQANESMLKQIAETAPGILFQFYVRRDGGMGFHYLSPRGVAFFGVDAEELSETWVSRVDPEVMPEMMDSIVATTRAQLPWQFEARVRDAAGDMRWMRMMSSPIRSDESEVVYGGFLLDITEQRAAQEAVAESEKRYRALVDDSLQGLVVEQIHNDFRLLFVNDAAARMFGYDSADDALIEGSARHLIPEDVQARSLDAWRQIEAGAIEQVRDRARQYRRDGSEFVADVLGRRVMWNGEPALQMALVDVTEQVRLEEELRRLASTDALTGLPNRREFELLADQEFRRGRRHGEPAALLMFDLDHFKRVNDEHGHAGGDVVLRRFAATLREVLRDSDIVARFGGEEFVALLIDTPRLEAVRIAERIRGTWEGTPVEFDGKAIGSTVSIGVRVLGAEDAGVSDALAHADAALYEAKARGRNRVAA